MAPCEATLALLMLLAPAGTGGVSTPAGDPPAPSAEDGPVSGATGPTAAAGALSVPPATVLSTVSTDVVDGRLRITVRGNGRVQPVVARYARTLPPRVVIDVPGVTFDVAPVTRIARLEVQQVRFQRIGWAPPVTRIVVDLRSKVPFAAWQEGPQGKDLAVLFGEVTKDAGLAAAPASSASDPPSEHAPPTIASTPPPAVASGPPRAATVLPGVDTDGVDGPAPATDGSGPSAEDPPVSAVPPWMQSVPRSASGQPSSGVPEGTSNDSGSAIGFVGLRGFRAALGVGYDRWETEVRDGYNLAYDNSVTSPLVTLQGTLWLVDPRILTINALADFRFDRQTYVSDVLETRTADTMENYRVNLVLLSGRGSPLSLYFERAGFSLDQRQNPTLTGDVVNLSQTGRQSTRGFSWDLNSSRFPHVSASGSVTDLHNFGSFLSGWDSSSHQERFDLRADKEHRLLRYDVSYAHDQSRFQYPLATLSTNYAMDVVRGTTYVTPRPGLNFTAGARMTTFAVGRIHDLDRQRNFTGAGGNVGAQWRWAPQWRLDVNYNMSTNENEAALSQVSGAGAPPADEQNGLALRRKFLYQDFDGRVTFSPEGGSTSAAVFVRGLSLDPVTFGLPTLDRLAMAGGRVDVRRGVSGFDLTLGAEAAAGRSLSSRGDTAPYHEVSGRVGATRRLATLTLSANAGIRDTAGSYFYPVTGRSWFGGLDVSYDASRQVQLRGAASRAFLLRDVVFQRGDDHTDSYLAGLRGPRFDVAVEYANTQSTAEGLLETAWLAEANPDVLRATRPELFGFLYASQQLRRSLDARVTVLRGLDVFARGRLDRLELPSAEGTGFLNQNVGQIGAIWAVRQLQVEIGWEYLEYWSQLVSTVDRRFHVRVRRDLLVR